jgi:Predicted membrane protein
MVIFQNIKKLIQVGLFLDKNKVKEQANKIVLGAGLLLMVGVMFQSVREFIGKGMDIFMSPVLLLVGDSNFFLILSAMAIITAIYSSLIQKYAVDQSKVFETQEKMKIFQKEMREAQQTQNTYMLKKLEEQQAEIMQENMAMMKTQFKPMLYIVFVSIPLLMWAYYYIGLHPDASMIFPFWGEQNLSGRVFFMFTYWLFWYFMSSLAFSQVLRKFLNIRAAGM